MRIPREIDVPERRAAHRRRARWGRFRRWGLGAAALGLPFAVLPADQAKSQALPTGGNVVGGSGTISQTSANQLTINQNSATLSIDWQSFSVGAGNIVRFIQPDSSSLALNRVIGPDPSMIFGSIQANGRVVIMNPAGIYFGPSSMVDVNGLVATTSRMSQADFLAGNLNFSIAGDVNARVINEGFVNVVQGGFAVLSAAAVENKGTIVAQGGTVVLAGTPTFTLDFFGDGLLKFASTGTVTQAPAGANALVENSGTVQANGGRVLMTARAARDVINNVINVTGIVEARSARVENGEIVIDGGENGTTVVAGRLDVSGNEADAKGGNVTVLGGRVELAAGTDIRASGEAGGGTVLVGGGQHGQGTAYNAQTLYMDAAAVIDANATLNGKGGKVVLWADDTTRMEGTITARGGTIAGDGGFVETSGKNRITFADTVAVDTRAFNGRDGMLLIDPNEFNIAPFGADMSAAVLVGLLATNDITIDSNTGTTVGAGHINVSDAITYTGVAARTLTFNAVGTINLDETITATNGALNLVLQAGGDVSITSAITTNNGSVLVEGRDGVGALGGNFQNHLNGSISLGTGALTLNTTGGISFNREVTTSGAVTLNAGGAVTQTYGILGGANLVIGGTGAVTLNDPGNTFANITLNRAGTTTNVSLVTSATPNVQASTLGIGTFYLSGTGFTQSGAIVQDPLADSFTIQGNGGTVTLSQANTFTGDLTVLAGTINVTADQSFDIASAAVVSLTSSGNIALQGTPATAVIAATGAGMINVVANAGGTLTVGGKIVTEGGDVSLVAGTKATINAGIETFGGDIAIWGNAPGGTPSGTPSSGINVGVNLQRTSATAVTIDAGGGDISIAGAGGNGGTYSHGVLIDGVVVQTSGTGAIDVAGKAGASAGGAEQVGVYINGDTFLSSVYSPGTALVSGSGGITVTGYGGASGSGGTNTGVRIARATLTATGGDVSVTGTGGAGLNSHSIEIAGADVLATGAGGQILLWGQAPVGTGDGIALRDSYDGASTSVTIGGASFQGDLNIVANSLTSAASTLALSRQSGGGTIQFENVDPSLGIGINGGSASGGMVMTPGILASIAGYDTLKFGGTGMTGSIQVDNGAFYSLVPGVSHFEFQTQGTFYSNPLQFSSQAVTLDIGGTTTTTILGATTVTFMGNGDVTATVVADAIALDKGGTSAAVTLTSSGSMTLAASTMGSGALSLTAGGTGITQTGALVQDASGGNVTINSTGTIILSQTNEFTGATVSIQGGSLQITGQQNFSRGTSQLVNLTSTTSNVLVGGNLVKSSGTGGATFNIDAAETAWFANAGIDSDNGNITVWGNAPGGDNSAGTNAGTAWGVRIDGANAILSAGAGNIDIVGKGSTDAGTGQHGIVLINGGKLLTDSGDILLSGRGGAGTGAGAQGIIIAPNSQIQTQSGYIELYGYGGANSANAQGISLDTGASIVNASGSQIRLNGQAMNGGIGIEAVGAAHVEATTGQIEMISNNGILLDAADVIAGGGASFTAATGNIALNNAGNQIAGNLTLAASAGSASLVNNSVNTITLTGINVSGTLAIDTLGNIVQDATAMNLQGAADFSSFGVIALNNLNNNFGGAVAISSYGNASIKTSGALTLDTVDTHGFAFTADAGDGLNVASSIITAGGNITLYGNAPSGMFGTSSVANFGVAIDGVSAFVNAGGGDIVIKGAGGTAGSHGVTIRNGAGVQTMGSGSITIEGQGGNGGPGAAGVEFYAGGAYAQTQHGALTVTGTGGTSGYGNIGVALATGEIRSIGSGNVTVMGIGGGLASVGVHVGGGGTTQISASDGDITINAIGGGAGSSGWQSRGLEVGVNQTGASQIGTITTSGVGSVIITATAGGVSGDNDRYGVIVGSGGGIVTQFAGISVTATGGTGSGTNNHAVYLDGGGITTLGASAGISLLADSLAAEIGSTVSSLGTVTLAPQTTGADIGIGGGSGVVQLPSDLSVINAATLKIGNGTTGLISVGAGGMAPTGVGSLYLHGTSVFLDGDITMPTGTLTLHGYSGGVVQNTGSSIDVNNLVLRGTGNFTLDGGGSGYNAVRYVAADVSGQLILRTQSASTYTDAASIADASGTVNGISATGSLSWTAQGNIGQSTGANVVVGGPVNLESLSGGITLYEAGNVFTGLVGAGAYGGAVSLRAGSLTVGSGGIYAAGDLILATTMGAIQQSGGLTVGGNFYASAADGILLTNSSNAVTGNVSLTTTGGSNATWIENGNLSLGASNVSGNLTVSVTSGSISQVGALSVTGTSDFAVSSGNLGLSNASNAFGGALSMSVTNGAALITTAGSLTLGNTTAYNGLTVVAGGALTQSGGPILVSTGMTNLSATGTMTLTDSGNNFGTGLNVTGPGGSFDGAVNGATGGAAIPNIIALGAGFTFGGVAVPNSGGSSGGGNEATTTSSITTETLAQIILQILTSTVTQSSSQSSLGDPTTASPISPTAIQAVLTAILAEIASPAGGSGGGQQGSGEGGNTQQAGAQQVGASAGGGAQSGTPNPAAGTGTFAAGTTITINTSGGTVQSITVTPVGGGAPVTILPGLLNLTPPAIPTATATGTPGISGNFPLAWGGR